MGLLIPGRVYPGSTIRIAGKFLDPDDADIDPNVSVVFKWKAPASEGGTETTYTYGTNDEVQKESVGDYTADVRPTCGGRWLYRWEAQSLVGVTIYVAGEGSVVVQDSEFSGYESGWAGDYCP